jgi:PmbA protein
LSLEAVQELYKKVLLQMDYLESDPHKGFPAPAKGKPDLKLSSSLWDETLFCENWDSIIQRLKGMEADVLASDKRIKSVLRLAYGESRGEVAIASTRGILNSERGGSASVGLSALGEQDSDQQIGSSFQSVRHRAGLDFKKVAKEGSSRTVALLGSRKLPSGRRSVIFDPWIAGEFLDLVSGLLCADQVQRGKSLLANKLEKKVASELVSFSDDPRKPGGMASSIYDDEGLPTRRKAMVEKGVLKEYFYDTYTANRDKRIGNSSASRGSYRGLPSPGSSNFYLEPGKTSQDKIISETKDGIVVLEVMGMHMADPISGEFSVGVSGISIKDGKFSHPVKSAMISGNLLELLERIDAVGDDLTFYGGMGAPTFRVSHMEVA